jgi:hypothetical protein
MECKPPLAKSLSRLDSLYHHFAFIMLSWLSKYSGSREPDVLDPEPCPHVAPLSTLKNASSGVCSIFRSFRRIM